MGKKCIIMLLLLSSLVNVTRSIEYPIEYLGMGFQQIAADGHSVHKVSSTSTTTTNNGLLGPWLVQERPKNLIAFDTNFNKTGIPVYQIKVLNQVEDKETEDGNSGQEDVSDSGDCWIHAFRNCLYFIDMIKKPRTAFNTIYKAMVSREQYQRFAPQNYCPLPGSATREFIKTQLDCAPECMPKDSEKYLADILTFEFEPIFSEKEEFKTALERARKELMQYGENNPSDHLVFDYAVLTLKFNRQKENLERLIKLIHQLQGLKTYVCGFSSTSSTIDHETTLVMHKHNGMLECLFADSNNVSLKGDNYTVRVGNKIRTYTMPQKEYNFMVTTFRAQIEQILRFIQNKNYFDDLMIRVCYTATVYEFNRVRNSIVNDPKQGVDLWKAAVNTPDFAVKALSFFYDQLSRYGLLNNKLYQSNYKKLYCKQIKDAQKEHANNRSKQLYNTLLNKVTCK